MGPPFRGEVEAGLGGNDERSLPMREEMLSAVAYAAREFLRTSAWEEAVPHVLRRLGEAAAVSRAYIFQNKVINSVLTQTEIFEWSAPE